MTFPHLRALPRAPRRRGATCFGAALGLMLGVGVLLGDAPHAASQAPPAPQAPAPAASQAWDVYGEFDTALARLDLEEARRRADLLDSGPTRALALGRLAHVQGDYREAKRLLEGAAASPAATARVVTLAQQALRIVDGTLEALRQNAPQRSGDGSIEVTFADQRDAVLAPYLFELLEITRATVGAALDVQPPPPLRYEIFDAPESLSLATPLELKAVYTTGTVGLCKYHKVMQLSPRTMLHGYQWADTAVHEYTHLLVTIRSKDRAPVWLQEGLAKLYEQRWRSDGPPSLDPARAKLLRDAIVSDSLITLEQMHPSIALLPSQEDAALAYTEVQTMLGMVWRRGDDAAIRAMLDDVAAGVAPKQALANAWGGTFEDFMAAWKREMLRRTEGMVAAFEATQFKVDGASPESGKDVFSHLEGGRGRQLARLGLMLATRGHTGAATVEFERARAASTTLRDDPILARELGRLYLKQARGDEALPLLERASRTQRWRASLAADHGRALRLSGALARARERLMDAIWVNPFIPGIHCDLAALATDPETRAREQRQCNE